MEQPLSLSCGRARDVVYATRFNHENGAFWNRGERQANTEICYQEIITGHAPTYPSFPFFPLPLCPLLRLSSLLHGALLTGMPLFLLPL